MTLDQAGTETVTVDYATADGTAAEGSDYTATAGADHADGDRGLSPTNDGARLTIDDAPDHRADWTPLDEPIEAFTVTLGDAGGATIADGEATDTITDNDVPALSIDDVTVEDAGSASIAVTLAGRHRDGDLDYATVDGTAAEGSDYTATLGDAGGATIADGGLHRHSLTIADGTPPSPPVARGRRVGIAVTLDQAGITVDYATADAPPPRV